MKTQVKEIFTSIQGEGPYVGYKQLFIRFCGCNLNCNYCDTDFGLDDSKLYSVDDLIETCKQYSDCHSVSLTGGEPLLNIDFLKEFIPQSPLPVYLETNGTLHKNMAELRDYVSYVAMDIKLPSCSGLQPMWEAHDEFLSELIGVNAFIKVVFDSNISEYEILKTSKLASRYERELILQPKMNKEGLSVTPDCIKGTLDSFLKIYPNVRVIPQVHRFIDVE